MTTSEFSGGTQVSLPPDARNLIERLLCNVEDRLGSHGGAQEVKVCIKAPDIPSRCIHYQDKQDQTVQRIPFYLLHTCKGLSMISGTLLWIYQTMLFVRAGAPILCWSEVG